MPYLDGTIQSDEVGSSDFSIEGLPLLITKISYNIPTADIIDNLATQVHHLVSQQEEIESLRKTNDQLTTRSEQLQDLIDNLTRENKELQISLDDASSRLNWRNLFQRRKS